jgi:hypothetical protein
MAEWSNAAVSKTVVLHSRDRGFESPSLRKAFMNPAPAGLLVLLKPLMNACMHKELNGKLIIPEGFMKALQDVLKGIAEGNPRRQKPVRVYFGVARYSKRGP